MSFEGKRDEVIIPQPLRSSAYSSKTMICIPTTMTWILQIWFPRCIEAKLNAFLAVYIEDMIKSIKPCNQMKWSLSGQGGKTSISNIHSCFTVITAAVMA